MQFLTCKVNIHLISFVFDMHNRTVLSQIKADKCAEAGDTITLRVLLYILPVKHLFGNSFAFKFFTNIRKQSLQIYLALTFLRMGDLQKPLG